MDLIITLINPAIQLTQLAMPYIDPKLKGDEAVTSLKTEGEESTPSTRATQQQEQPEHERPEFTIQNVLGDIRYGFNQLVFNPDFNIIIVPILVTVESIVVKMIRGLVSCKLYSISLAIASRLTNFPRYRD